MRHHQLALLFSLLLLAVASCRPNVGAPISLIGGPAILAVKGQPAEVIPGAMVSYEVLAVDSGGRIPAPAPGGDVTSPAQWAICELPKAPVDTNSVNADCLDTDTLPGQPGATDVTYSAPTPMDACYQFGPLTPPVQPGQPAIQPRAPDVTDGYYLPVRVSLQIPENLQRPGMATADSIVAFGLERISCGLANVRGPINIEYTKNYTLNVNPAIDQLTWQQGGTDPAVVSRVETGAAAIQVQNGQTVTFSLSWTADSVETYPAYDILSRSIQYHREAMRVAWYATGGTFEHDVTGRSESETDVFAANTWKSSSAGLIHLWIVLHDSRGGTDFAAFDLEVI
jgi:hypothetical protein